MNKIRLINNKGIVEGFSSISNDYSVEIEFELKNMGVSDVQSIRKFLNRMYNDKKIWFKDWEIVSNYRTGVLLKGVDNSGNGVYIEIMKVGDNNE